MPAQKPNHHVELSSPLSPIDSKPRLLSPWRWGHSRSDLSLIHQIVPSEETVGLGKYFEELNVGDTFTTPHRTVTEADIALFAGLSGDYNPLHTDAVFAQTTPFRTKIAHGILTLAIASGLDFRIGIADGTLLALIGINELRFPAPVRSGDTLHSELEVTQKKEASKPDRGVIVIQDRVLNQRGETVLEYERVLLFARKGESKQPVL